LLQTQLNQAQVTIGLQQQQITNFQSDIQQLRQENAQLKMDLKLVLMKLNLQGQTPQSSDGKLMNITSTLNTWKGIQIEHFLQAENNFFYDGRPSKSISSP
jgi:hypothetical protein